MGLIQGFRARAIVALRAAAIQVRRPLGWWAKLEAAERVLYRAAVLLGVGFGMIHPALGLIVPGVLFALVVFGFNFRRTS